MSKDSNYIRLINSRRWRAVRGKKLMSQTLCEDCESEGKVRLASEVHHIVPVESRGSLTDMENAAFDPNNLVSLCRDCHKRRHRELRSSKKEERKERETRRRESFEDKFYR